MYRFIESIDCQDKKMPFLEFHQRRVNGVFENFGDLKKTLNLAKILSEISLPDDEKKYKIRILYNENSDFFCEINPYYPVEIQEFQLVECSGLDYTYKYLNREIFSQIKNQTSGREPIILQNQFFTDSSFSNLVFFSKNGQWHTPKTFLLNGVKRQFLLERKIIFEKEISERDLSDYTHFKFINAMLDWDKSPKYSVKKLFENPKILFSI